MFCPLPSLYVASRIPPNTRPCASTEGALRRGREAAQRRGRVQGRGPWAPGSGYCRLFLPNRSRVAPKRGHARRSDTIRRFAGTIWRAYRDDGHRQRPGIRSRGRAAERWWARPREHGGASARRGRRRPNRHRSRAGYNRTGPGSGGAAQADLAAGIVLLTDRASDPPSCHPCCSTSD